MGSLNKRFENAIQNLFNEGYKITMKQIYYHPIINKYLNAPKSQYLHINKLGNKHIHLIHPELYHHVHVFTNRSSRKIVQQKIINKTSQLKRFIKQSPYLFYKQLPLPMSQKASQHKNMPNKRQLSPPPTNQNECRPVKLPRLLSRIKTLTKENLNYMLNY